jgi:hypothetical protein
VVTLDASRIAELALAHGMKNANACFEPPPEDPTNPPPPTNTLAVAVNAPNTPQTVPASLRAELEELLGVALPSGNPAAPRTLPVPAPVVGRPTAAALQTLLDGNVALSGPTASRVMRELEIAEVSAQGPNANFAAALARLTKLRPRHYTGPVGALRRARLWFRCHGAQVVAGVAVVILLGGVATLCVFCPIAGIVVAAYAILVLGAGAGSATHQ